jgi:NAD(P)-dependent dehydrogenase (short-subunit alcohol dehydrogenase family)/acyl dehydratase/putative sterol carrier protein
VLLKDQVVLITGAGNGIGRAYALAFAAAGARVVVNDLGGARDGDGASDAPARAVVQEILALGGDAVADFGNVTVPADCARMVEAAVARWGRLDAVVNNAGVLRDRTFSKLTDEEWDLVVAVHLTGTRNVVRAALPALSQAGGSIINTTSYSGMIGNFGQANYAAAKAGIYGFTRVLAVELQRANITANCIAPIAKTRMTEDIGRIGDDWTPAQIAPVAVFLASPLARKVTGKVFGVAGQRIHLYEVQTNTGVEKEGAELWTAEDIAALYADISAFAVPATTTAATAATAVGASSPVRDVFALAPKAFRADRAGDLAMRLHFAISDAPGQTLVVKDGKAWVEEGLTGSPDCTMKTDAETIIGIFKQTVDATKAFMKGKITADNLPIVMKFATVFDFSTPRPEATMPAAPPAATAETAQAKKVWPIGKRYDGGYQFADPAHALAYAHATSDTSPAYHGADPICPPMFHVRLMHGVIFQIATDPELGLDLLRLVHGEHDATFHKVIRPWDLVHTRGELLSVEEKSSGLLVKSGLYGFVDGQLAVSCTTVYFIRGTEPKAPPKPATAAGGAPAPQAAPPTPDHSLSVDVAADQSLQYAAASLDDNPIHTDPATAAAAGLPGVILQGLCTMAMSGAAVTRALADNDARRVQRIAVRFARPVLNGQALTVQCWSSDTGCNFTTLNAAGQPVLSHALFEVR